MEKGNQKLLRRQSHQKVEKMARRAAAVPLEVPALTALAAQLGQPGLHLAIVQSASPFFAAVRFIPKEKSWLQA